jgi:hypothetical protein
VFFSSRSRFCSCSCVFFWRGYCLAAFQVGCRSDFCHDYGGVIIDFFFRRWTVSVVDAIESIGLFYYKTIRQLFWFHFHIQNYQNH